MDAAEVKEMVHIAHEEGFAVMSHTNGIYGTRAAIEAGVDSLEHGNYMDEETIAMLADSITVWVPTLVTVRNLSLISFSPVSSHSFTSSESPRI